MLFELANLGDLNKPLTPKILSDSSNKITKHIIYLYTMESFIYAEMNKASRDKDKSKIKYYGAFAAALSYIIDAANSNRKTNKLVNFTKLYRGIKMQFTEVNSIEQG